MRSDNSDELGWPRSVATAITDVVHQRKDDLDQIVFGTPCPRCSYRLERTPSGWQCHHCYADWSEEMIAQAVSE